MAAFASPPPFIREVSAVILFHSKQEKRHCHLSSTSPDSLEERITYTQHTHLPQFEFPIHVEVGSLAFSIKLLVSYSRCLI